MLDELSSEGLTFDDGRGLYPESLKAHVPLGTRVRVRRKADAEGISAGELIRRAVFFYLNARTDDVSRTHQDARA
jgi:hypothetical protein